MKNLKRRDYVTAAVGALLTSVILLLDMTFSFLPGHALLKIAYSSAFSSMTAAILIQLLSPHKTGSGSPSNEDKA